MFTAASSAGRKRWAAYPPGRVPPGVHISVGDSGEVDVDEPSALRWFLDVYPNIPEAERPLEWVQHAGETVFVPGGWWHIVLNLEVLLELLMMLLLLQNHPLGQPFLYLAVSHRMPC